jgi:hypothetical protein
MAPFVKLDCGMLDSSLWIDKEARDVFITGLLMAEPFELQQPKPQLEVRAIKETGFIVPAGWYGIVRAAGTGIVRRAGLKIERGLDALERLGAPDADSRSGDYEGRRVVRTDGGYLILNFAKYRERDYGAAERAKRYRERKRHAVASRDGVTRTRNVTQAEAEAEAYKEKKDKTPTATPDGAPGLWTDGLRLVLKWQRKLGGNRLAPEFKSEGVARAWIGSQLATPTWAEVGPRGEHCRIQRASREAKFLEIIERAAKASNPKSYAAAAVRRMIALDAKMAASI